MRRLRAWSKGASGWAASLLVVLAAAVLAEILAPVQAFDAYLAEHEDLTGYLRAVTTGMALLGALVLALAQFLPEPRRPPETTGRHATAAMPPLLFGEVRRRGGRESSGEASFAAVKAAWRQRAWRVSRPWRVLFVMMGGAILVLFGICGLFIVIGPPAIKVLFAGLLLYAVGRTTWAFARV